MPAYGFWPRFCISAAPGVKSMCRFPVVMLAAASVYSLVVPAGVAVAGDVGSVDLRAQFEARARTAWSKIVELSRKSDVELVEKQFRKDRVDEYHWTTKFADANVCYSIGYVNVPSFGGHRSGQGTVTCCNSRYGFELSRTAKIRPWTVNYVGSDVGQVSEKALQEGAALLPQFGLFVWMFFLPDLIEQDGFTVLGVEAVDRPTGRLAAVRFENKRPKDEIIFWIQGGTLVLSGKQLGEGLSPEEIKDFMGIEVLAPWSEVYGSSTCKICGRNFEELRFEYTPVKLRGAKALATNHRRSEEHTSELQSH